MSDAAKPAEIEDVLSSIRRLVAGGAADPAPEKPKSDIEPLNEDLVEPTPDLDAGMDDRTVDMGEPERPEEAAHVDGAEPPKGDETDATATLDGSDSPNPHEGLRLRASAHPEAPEEEMVESGPSASPSGFLSASSASSTGPNNTVEDVGGSIDALVLSQSLRVEGASHDRSSSSEQVNEDLTNAALPEAAEAWHADAHEDARGAKDGAPAGFHPGDKLSLSTKAALQADPQTGDASDAPTPEEAGPSRDLGAVRSDRPRRSPFLSEALQKAQRLQVVQPPASRETGEPVEGTASSDDQDQDEKTLPDQPIEGAPDGHAGFRFRSGSEEDPTRHVPLRARDSSAPATGVLSEQDQLLQTSGAGTGMVATSAPADDRVEPDAAADGAALPPSEDSQQAQGSQPDLGSEADAPGRELSQPDGPETSDDPEPVAAEEGAPAATEAEQAQGTMIGTSDEERASEAGVEGSPEDADSHGPIIAPGFARRPVSRARDSVDLSKDLERALTSALAAQVARATGPDPSVPVAEESDAGALPADSLTQSEAFREPGTFGEADDEGVAAIHSMPTETATPETCDASDEAPSGADEGATLRAEPSAPVEAKSPDAVAPEMPSGQVAPEHRGSTSAHGLTDQAGPAVAESSTVDEGVPDAAGGKPDAGAADERGQFEGDASPETTDNLFGEPREVDEEQLRALIAEVVHKELQGQLGERVTRNIRRLVQREIARALEARGND
ncbi:MAG: hypothetical protein AAFR47_03970 [Pseudomonadota bacterium]